jgi:hypothetical protein
MKKYNIEVGFQNVGKISDHLGSTKDKEIDKSRKSGIYLLKCNDCDAEYVGMTKRTAAKRDAEHRADCHKPLNPESAMAYHCITSNHTIKDGVELLKEVNEPSKLSIWESLKLFKRKDKNLANIIKEGNSPSILFETLI